ncbi:MAG: hypothetical protein QGH40_10535, partial [bacterium]|nr:hypothetical protein [bacterium]
RKQITSRAALFTMVILVPVLILSTLAAIRNRLYLVYMTPLIFALDEKDIFSKDKSIPIGTVMVLIGMVFSLLAFDSNWIITNITYTERESVQNFIRAHKLFGNYLTIYPDDGTLLNMEKVTTFTNARINVFIDEEISAEIHETWFKDFLGPLGENQLPDKQTIEKTKALLGKLEIDFILIRWPHEDITNTVNRAFAALGSDITLVDSYFGVVRLR